MVRFYLISLFVVLLDQTTKLLTKHFMDLHDSKEVIGNLLRYTYIRNPGMAFGIQIGNNVVVSAGSVLGRDIPNNCLVAGNPARAILTSFDCSDYFKTTIKDT